jgi:hypothetical protein
MTKSPEQLDELISRVKKHGDFSSFQKSPEDNGTVNLVSIIANIPKARIPQPDLARVRSKILDRISLPSEKETGFAFLQYVPRFIRVGSVVMGGLMILVSMTVGTAVAAMESVPGQKIYPVKKIVESVQLKLATSEEEKTELQIKFANNRVEEMEAILQKQKEGKVSEAQVQKVVANTAKDIEKTTQAVAEQSKNDPKSAVVDKMVSLSNKQTTLIQAAQVESEGEVKIQLDKALVDSKTSMEKAIENIEKAGLVVENRPIILMDEPKTENTVTAEGKLTAVSSTSLSIGTAQFLLTKDTEYVNIKLTDLKVDVIVKISGEIKEKKTYAAKVTKIEVQPTEKPADNEPDDEPEDDPTETPNTSTTGQ